MPPPTAALVAAAGLVALASAMGIGRFAFTPMLPLMQAAGQITLHEGALLAAANYAGYLVGALALVGIRVPPAASARVGLVVVALVTIAMAFTHAWLAWVVLRFVAGVTSAAVLVGVAGWALPLFAAGGRPRLGGIVFAGVGVGIALAGLVGCWAAIAVIGPQRAWLALGLLAIGACVAMLPMRDHVVARVDAVREPLPLRTAMLPVACYGAFGFGYILPATFLPALAREALPDATTFAWAWPLFGIAAALSTLLAARFAGRARPIGVWAAAQAMMALGVLAPVVSHSLAAIATSALCVGGTFMIVTMAGIEHARAIGGGAAARLVAAMTAAFAAGQLAGPLVLAAFAQQGSPDTAAIVAAVVLFASALALWRNASVTVHFQRKRSRA